MEYLALSNVSVTIGGYEECEEEHEYYTKTFKHECHQRGDSVFLNTRIYKIKQQSCPLNKIIVTLRGNRSSITGIIVYSQVAKIKEY